MIDVRKDARLGMATLQGNQRSLPQPAQRSRGTPELDLGHDADLLAYFQENAIALSGLEQIEVGLIRRPRGWRRDALAADLLHQLHDAPGLFQSLLATPLVIHKPFKKGNGAGDAQAAVANPLAQNL